MAKHRNELILSLIIFGTVIAVLVLVVSSKKVSEEVQVTSDYAEEIEPLSEVYADNSVKEYPSPDGKYVLVANNETEADGIVVQTFTINNLKDDTSIEIYRKDSPVESLISVPENTFSPNDKYIFLTLEENWINKYLVLRTDNKEINSESKFLEIESLFRNMHPEYTITDITGWGGYNVLVVNTDTKEDKTGPSWWFDASNSSFYKLSTRFN